VYMWTKAEQHYTSGSWLASSWTVHGNHCSSYLASAFSTLVLPFQYAQQQQSTFKRKRFASLTLHLDLLWGRWWWLENYKRSAKTKTYTRMMHHH